MKPFLSTVTNRVDKKGRVSVPASFRTAVTDSSFKGVYLFPSFNDKSIEGFSMEGFSAVTEMVDQLPPFSAQRDALADSIIGKSDDFSFDGEGRIKLTAIMLEHAGIEDEAMFVGLGSKFKIWAPAAYAMEQDRLAALARESREGLGMGSGR